MPSPNIAFPNAHPHQLLITRELKQGQIITSHFSSPTSTIWLSAPIAIFTVVLGPPVSQAADHWGRKPFLVVLTLFGAAGCLAVARAGNIATLIAGFCLIGVAFGTQPLLHVVTSEVLPRRWRAWGQAADMLSNSLGGIVGLYVGAAVNRSGDPAGDGFRVYYYMTMGVFLLAAGMTGAVYNPPALPLQVQEMGLSTRQKLGRLDWVGYGLLASGLVLFSVGLSYSKNPYEWSDPHVSATFAVGMVLALGLVGYETWVREDGMFHHGLFTGNRNFAVATLCVFAEGVAFFAANTYFAFQVSVFYETDSLLVGVRYSIMMYVSAIAAGLTGWYCAAARRVRVITVAAFIIFTVFFVCMATTTRTGNAQVWFFPVLLGTALGMTLTTLITAAQLSTPPELISVASGLIISVRSLGGTIGLAIYNALFNDAMGDVGHNIADAVLPKGLAPQNLGPFIKALTERNTAALTAIPDVTPEMIGAGADALADTFLTAFHHVWIAAACFVGAAAIGKSVSQLCNIAVLTR